VIVDILSLGSGSTHCLPVWRSIPLLKGVGRVDHGVVKASGTSIVEDFVVLDSGDDLD
jgi:hypothetical protein